MILSCAIPTFVSKRHEASIGNLRKRDSFRVKASRNNNVLLKYSHEYARASYFLHYNDIMKYYYLAN